MRYINTIFLFIFLNGFSQVEYPKLNLYGRTIESFVPSDWKIISLSEGDLNKDNMSDYAFVIEKKEVYNSEEDSIPKERILRILGVFFKQKEGGILKHFQSNTIILVKNETMFEPFQGVNISTEGLLELNFQIWKEKTKWFISTHSYKFLFQNGKFDLVQYFLNETNRDTGDTTDYTLNFSKRTMEIYAYKYLFDKPTTTENRKFKLDSLKTLESFTTFFEWEFQGLMI